MLKQSSPRSFRVTLLLLIAMLLLVACSTGTTSDEPAAAVQSTPTAALGATAESTTGAEAAADTTGAITFQLVQAGTEARFNIYELLMGQDKTVVGTTSAVEGAITVDPANPAATTISPIRIDARTLKTDSDRRDGAISRFVLQTNQDAYQYIVFTPTAITGLPAAVAIGDAFEFTVTGDLTIRDVTKEEIFTVTVTANSATELVGLGTTTLLRSDYGLTIPSVPSVANVAEEVPLEIEFTAIAS
jgi:polyisoprenoid-binding protein YceI